MKMEEKVLATIADLSREDLIDALDEYVGVGCRDEQDTEDLRNELLAAYKRGDIDGDEFMETYGC